MVCSALFGFLPSRFSPNLERRNLCGYARPHAVPWLAQRSTSSVEPGARVDSYRGSRPSHPSIENLEYVGNDGEELVNLSFLDDQRRRQGDDVTRRSNQGALLETLQKSLK